MGRPRETRGDSDLVGRRLSRSRGGRSAASLVAALAVFGVILSTQAGAAPAALPSISIADSEALQYQVEKTTMTFEVTLSAASASTVTVNYATGDDFDHNDDYVPTSGTLSYAPGETKKTIDVELVPEPGETNEPDEIFHVDLSNPVNATLDKWLAYGTIHFQGNPKPTQVNVTAKGEGGQCVQTVDSPGCVPLSGESQFEIDDVKYINPGRRAIELHTTEGIARFYGAAFGLDKVDAAESGTGKPVVLAVLRGGNFGACSNRALSGTRSTSGIAKKKPKPQAVRRLWGKGSGRFRTKGRYSSGTVRGTWWVTIDRCDGTRTLVREGVVSVYDFVLKKTVKVAAGHSYLASPSKKP